MVYSELETIAEWEQKFSEGYREISYDGYYSQGAITMAPWFGREDLIIEILNSALCNARHFENYGTKKLQASRINIVQEMANFYSLLAITGEVVSDKPTVTSQMDNVRNAGMKLGYDPYAIASRMMATQASYLASPEGQLVELYNLAQAKLVELVDKMDELLLYYSIHAVGRELRHHVGVNLCGDNYDGVRGNILPGSSDPAVAVWMELYDQYGVSLIELAESLNREYEDVSYCGDKWADACAVIVQRLNSELGPTDHLNKRMFIDRVFSLQHNSGSFLNKFHWASYNQFEKHHNQNVMDTPAGKATCESMGLGSAPNHVLHYHSKAEPDVQSLAWLANKDIHDIVMDIVQASRALGLPIRCEFDKVQMPLQASVKILDNDEDALDWSDELEALNNQQAVTGKGMEFVEKALASKDDASIDLHVTDEGKEALAAKAYSIQAKSAETIDKSNKAMAAKKGINHIWELHDESDISKPSEDLPEIAWDKVLDLS